MSAGQRRQRRRIIRRCRAHRQRNDPRATAVRTLPTPQASGGWHPTRGKPTKPLALAETGLSSVARRRAGGVARVGPHESPEHDQANRRHHDRSDGHMMSMLIRLLDRGLVKAQPIATIMAAGQANMRQARFPPRPVARETRKARRFPKTPDGQRRVARSRACRGS
jgi:hypothetical protein